jgi:NitT/TauT family transport system substrate-binding protein
MRFARVTRPFRPSLVGVIGLAIALLASACGTSSSAGTTPTSGGLEKTHIKVGVVPIVDAAPFFLAIKEGYFRQEGLDVSYQVVAKSTDAIPDILHGTVDMVAAANYTSFFAADAHNTFKLSVIAPSSTCGTNTQNILVMPGSKIKTAADLVGKTIAVNINPNIQTITANAVLQAQGVNTALVKYTAINFALMGAALKQGRVDAISEVEPYLTNTERTLGAVSVLAQCQGPTIGIPLAGIVTTQQWAQKYPNTARAFQRALLKGNALADTDRQAVEKILPTYIPTISPETAALIALNSYPTTQDVTQLQRVADLMLSGKMLQTHLDVAPLLFH